MWGLKPPSKIRESYNAKGLYTIRVFWRGKKKVYTMNLLTSWVITSIPTDTYRSQLHKNNVCNVFILKWRFSAEIGSYLSPEEVAWLQEVRFVAICHRLQIIQGKLLLLKFRGNNRELNAQLNRLKARGEDMKTCVVWHKSKQKLKPSIHGALITLIRCTCFK